MNEVPPRPLVITGGEVIADEVDKDGMLIKVEMEVNDNGIIDS